MLVPLNSISLDPACQARIETDPGVIDEYAAAMRDGASFPPPVLFRDASGILRIGDGFHRVSAGSASIEAEVRDGDARDALECSVSSNARHGLRFSNRDKRRIVGLMLDDEEWAKLSDREIGRRCGVSQPFVGKLRAEWADNGYHPKPLSPAEKVALAEAEAMIEAGIEQAVRIDVVMDRMKQMLGPVEFEVYMRTKYGDRWPLMQRFHDLMLGREVDPPCELFGEELIKLSRAMGEP